MRCRRVSALTAERINEGHWTAREDLMKGRTKDDELLPATLS